MTNTMLICRICAQPIEEQRDRHPFERLLQLVLGRPCSAAECRAAWLEEVAAGADS